MRSTESIYKIRIQSKVLSVNAYGENDQTFIYQGGTQMFEGFTPGTLIAIAIASLTALTFFLVLIAFGSLSRIKKRFLRLGEKVLEFENRQREFQQVKHMTGSNKTSLTETYEKINSLESCLNQLESKIAETQNKLTEYASKLSDYERLIAQAGQGLGKDAANFKQAIQRVHTLEEEFQALKAFQHTFEQIRHRILDAFDTKTAGMWTDDSVAAQPDRFREEAPMPPDIRRTDRENPQYRYP